MIKLLTSYKNSIVGIVAISLLAIAGWSGLKIGSMQVQAKWDQQTNARKDREAELSARIIALQDQATERDRRQIEADAAAAVQGAAERARLVEQAKAVQSSLDKLTRNLTKAPQYAACKLDPDTLDELNRSLK